MTAQEKKDALDAIDVMIKAFDRVKNISKSDNLADEKGSASLEVFRAILEWRDIILAEKEDKS